MNPGELPLLIRNTPGHCDPHLMAAERSRCPRYHTKELPSPAQVALVSLQHGPAELSSPAYLLVTKLLLTLSTSPSPELRSRRFLLVSRGSSR